VKFCRPSFENSDWCYIGLSDP